MHLNFASTILSNHIINYSSSAENLGLIIHSTVTTTIPENYLAGDYKAPSFRVTKDEEGKSK